MNTIAKVLRSEIARVARRELKDEITSLRKLTSAHRSEIAALKRELKALGSSVKRLHKSKPTTANPQAENSADPAPTRRRRSAEFSAEKLAAHRAYLGMTQAQMAQLIRTSALSVYKWESGKVQPRAAQKEHIANALKIRKRAAWARFQQANK